MNQPRPLPGLVKLSTAVRYLPESKETLRRWCLSKADGGYGIGVQREHNKPWLISLPAARMLSACDREAFMRFKRGEWDDPTVQGYLGSLP